LRKRSLRSALAPNGGAGAVVWRLLTPELSTD
jgi:hypothetical protein